MTLWIKDCCCFHRTHKLVCLPSIQRLRLKPLRVLIYSGNFNSRLTAGPPDAALPAEVGVFQPFPLKLFHFVFAFD